MSLKKQDNSNILGTSWFINIWDICNAKCYFCFNKNWPLFFSKEDIFSKIDWYVKEWIFDIRYWVGEFTMHPNFFDILEYWRGKWVKQFIHTNGIKLAEPDFVEKLLELWINNINVSLHWIKSETCDKILWVKWSFKKTIKWIQNLKKYWINTTISFVITNDNINEILWIYLFCIKNKISLLKYSILSWNHSYNLDLVPSLLDIQKHLMKVLSLNKNIKFEIKLLNIPYCLVWNKEYKYIFENGDISNSEFLSNCEKCKHRLICCGYPIYYKKPEFNNFVNNYVKN